MTHDVDTVQRQGYAYKGASPWSAPPAADSDATCFHVKQQYNAAPQIRQFLGTINLGFTVNKDKRNYINISLLRQCFMSFAKQIYAYFRIEPINGSAQSISNPSNIPTSKEGVELYYQHRIVEDGVRGKITVAMSEMMGDLKDPATPFRKYLNKENVYVYQASLGLVNARIIGVMIHTDPQLNFRDDIKSSIFNIMRNNMPISVFTQCVPEVSAKLDNPRFTNGLAIQEDIKDGKETDDYTEKLSKAMELVNKHGNHPILSQYVFVPFGRGAAIDQYTVCSFIRMQNNFLHNFRHVEIYVLADIDKDIERYMGNDMDDGEDISNSIQEIILDATDNDSIRLLNSIECTMKSNTIIAIVTVDLYPSRQPDRALSTLNYGLTPDCNLSQSRRGRTPIACAHTNGNSNTYLSQVSYRNLLRSQYKQGCNQCEHSYTQVYQNLNAHQLHLNAPYKHLSTSVSTSPVERTY
jgi:hypothetical protein